MRRIRFARFRGWLYDNSDLIAIAVIVALMTAFAIALREG